MKLNSQEMAIRDEITSIREKIVHLLDEAPITFELNREMVEAQDDLRLLLARCPHRLDPTKFSTENECPICGRLL